MSLIDSIGSFLGFGGGDVVPSEEPRSAAVPYADYSVASAIDPDDPLGLHGNFITEAPEPRWHAGLEMLGGLGEAVGGGALALTSAGTGPGAFVGVPVGLTALGDGAARFAHGSVDFWNNEHTDAPLSTAAQLSGYSREDANRFDAGVNVALSLPGAALGTASLLAHPSLWFKGLGAVGGAAAGDGLVHQADYALTGNPSRAWLTQGLMDSTGMSETAALVGQAGASLIAPAALGWAARGTAAVKPLDAAVRWKPAADDLRFSNESPPVLGVAEFGFKSVSDEVAKHFAGSGGILQITGPSGVGKGYLTDVLKRNSPERDIQVLEQDWFMAPPEVRSGLVQKNLDRVSSLDEPHPPNEWKGFWDHRRTQGVLTQIRDAFDSGVATEVTIDPAWHRMANTDETSPYHGMQWYPESLHIRPDTLLIFDGKYPVNQLPGGRRFDHMSLRIEDDPANVRSKYEQRTSQAYPDPAVQQQKLFAYDNVIAPSYERFLALQQQYRLDNPGSPAAVVPDLILNVDLNYVAPHLR